MNNIQDRFVWIMILYGHDIHDLEYRSIFTQARHMIQHLLGISKLVTVGFPSHVS